MTQQESALVNVESREVSKVAALDIGSNSFHLVVARINAGSVQILHRVKQKVRLASGLSDDGILSDEAIERGLATLQVIAESLKGFEPDSVRVVATHTLRRARNARTFIRKAMDVFPYPIEIITGEEEAQEDPPQDDQGAQVGRGHDQGPEAQDLPGRGRSGAS